MILERRIEKDVGLRVDWLIGIKSSRGPLWSYRKKNRLKRVRQYIIIYFWLLIFTIAPMPPLEAFVFFYLNMRSTICERNEKNIS